MQTDHILEQDGKIEKLNGQIDEFWSRYSAQTMFLYACLVILILFAALLGIIVRAYWMKNRMNAELSSQKKKLEEQRDQLISLSKQLEEATHAKLVFFTNVSHDFRTPLTLVAAPVEQLLEDEALTSRQRSLLQMVHKNVTILLRLVNQILISASMRMENWNWFYPILICVLSCRSGVGHFVRWRSRSIFILY